LSKILPTSASLALLLLALSDVLFCQVNSRAEVQAHFLQAQRDFQAKRLGDAKNEFTDILRLDPKNAIAHYDLAGIAFQESQYAQAAQAFRSAFRLDPSMRKAQAFLGICEMRLGQTEEAREDLAESLPNITDPRLRKQVVENLVQIYYNEQNLNKVAGVLGAQTHSNDPELLYDAYRVYTQLASQALASLIQVDPASPRVREIVAQSLMNRRDFTGAIAEYRKAIHEDPHLSGVHFELGQAILADSQTSSARAAAKKEFEAELALDPSNAYAEYGLGEIAWFNSNSSAALKHFSRAVELSSGFAEAQIDLGKVLMKMGAIDQAVAHLRMAALREPQNPTAHYQLALAYRKLGRDPAAEREMTVFQELRKRQAASTPTMRLANELAGSRTPPAKDQGPHRVQHPNH
jgi:predicted Zn-dependent protease